MYSACAAAFARLCVETFVILAQQQNLTAAAFARLCVETAELDKAPTLTAAAAFARLCVETKSHQHCRSAFAQPPSRGCVLKPLDVAGV